MAIDGFDAPARPASGTTAHGTAPHYSREQRVGNVVLHLSRAMAVGNVVTAALASAFEPLHLGDHARRTLMRTRNVGAMVCGTAAALAGDVSGAINAARHPVTALRQLLAPARGHMRTLAVAGVALPTLAATLVLPAGIAAAEPAPMPAAATVATAPAPDPINDSLHQWTRAVAATDSAVAALPATPVADPAGTVVLTAAHTASETSIYRVRPNDNLSAIAAAHEETLGQIETDNPLDTLRSHDWDLIYPDEAIVVRPGGTAPMPEQPAAAVTAAVAPAASPAAPAPRAVQAVPHAPAVGGPQISGRMSWFGGPYDASDSGRTALGLTTATPGIAVYDQATLGGYWRVTFPNGNVLVLRQTDIGPAPWTGRVIDVTYSAMAEAGYGTSVGSMNTITDAVGSAQYLGRTP